MLIEILFLVPAILFAISIHEFAHGAMAYGLGDPTPKYQGRLTLNPLAHLDPLGAIMLLVFRFGWAKPVQVNPLYFKDRRKGMMLVAFAGPLANITSAFIFYQIYQIVPPLLPNLTSASIVAIFLEINIAINISLAAFNLLPFPPLDGSKILGGFLPLKYRLSFERLAQFSPVVLILLLWSGIFQKILSPVVNVLYFLIGIR